MGGGSEMSTLMRSPPPGLEGDCTGDDTAGADAGGEDREAEAEAEAEADDDDDMADDVDRMDDAAFASAA